MQRKKVDNRIRIQIENGVAERHRTLFVIVGDRGKDQVVILHHMLSKAAVKARPTVLWCYKKELGFSSHRKKRMRQLQKKIKSGMLDLKQDDPFELFIAATNIRYCYYNETHKILGNTFGMCVLQDFEALTPNLLARTIETVEGGGIIAILLRTMNSLKQLYTMTMDVHSRYRTEAHQDVVGRFNERFILSLVSCKTCVVVDDQLNILPISSHAANISALPPRSQEETQSPRDVELKELKESLQDTQPVGTLVDVCKTLDQFQDPDFGSLSGGRIVRIAVHPDYQAMGYGSRALRLLQMYYEGKFPCLEEKVIQKPREIATVSSEAVSLLEEAVMPRKDLPPLLLKLSERQAENLDYLGVSYGLTPRLLKFWKRGGYVPVYLRQTPNDLTGEHSCIMLKMLNEEEENTEESWLTAFWKDFRRRFLSLLSYQFSIFSPSLALNILQNRNVKQQSQSALSRNELEAVFIPYDLKRLEMYSRNMVDYHLIMDMIPTISRMYFLNNFGDMSLSATQAALLLGIGLQHKSMDQLEKEIGLPSSQLMGLFNRTIRKVVQLFNSVQEKAVEEQMAVMKEVVMEPTLKSLNEDLEEAAKEFQEKHKNEIGKLKDLDLSQYIIRGDDEEWNEVLSKAGQDASVVSLKSDKKRKAEVTTGPRQEKKFKKKNPKLKLKK
ncbi:RNA cytidine acetyltransferase [Notechis scutatus]|uniref:RNA cytidine acetyltransferase n=1 Tax=Notechis scutatus TaxID=8663 RepID=A0A6J1TR22_9SAUR|nr:RNA cytidine acetyltransferase [Notechis scutatus]